MVQKDIDEVDIETEAKNQSGPGAGSVAIGGSAKGSTIKTHAASDDAGSA